MEKARLQQGEKYIQTSWLCRSCGEHKENINRRSKLCSTCATRAVMQAAMQLRACEGIAYDNWERAMQSFYQRLIYKKGNKPKS